jgi:hypothetical protein
MEATMSSINHFTLCRTAVILLFSLILIQAAGADVIEDNGHTYLIDRTGERWDITQARSIGFEPRYFEFGIGRHAFRPLNDSDWSSGVDNKRANFRVIGVADGDEAHAYSVPKLSHHEIANTRLASNPIIAGY